MSSARPQFELARVYDDGIEDAPQVVPVTQLPWDTQMDRRGFLGVGMSAAALMLSLDGSSRAAEAHEAQSEDLMEVIKSPDVVLKAHKSNIYALAITSDGKLLASAASGEDGLKFWSLPDGRLSYTRKELFLNVKDLLIAPGDKSLIIRESDSVNLSSLPDLRLLSSIKPVTEEYLRMTVTPDGKTLFLWGDTIRTYSLPDCKAINASKNLANRVMALIFTPDSKTLIQGVKGGNIHLSSWPDGKHISTIQAHKEYVGALATTPDGKILASGNGGMWDPTIKLWSLPEGKLLATVSEVVDKASYLTITQDGHLLVSAGDMTIKLWSLPEGRRLATLQGHKHFISSIAATPDGRLLASADNSGVIILWNLERLSFRSFLFDKTINESGAKGLTYNVKDTVTGQIISYTLPCGSQIPPGAKCVCNCVSGSIKSSSGRSSSGGTNCTCNKVCTCVPVYRQP